MQTVTGTNDDTVAQQVIARDPAAAAQLRLQLAQLVAEQEHAARQADLAALTAQLQGVVGARADSGAGQAKSSIQWAPAIVSFVVLPTFGSVMWAALTRALPAGSETLLNMLLGTLAAMATSTVSYWVGSSAGSAQKTDMLYHSTPSVPPARVATHESRRHLCAADTDRCLRHQPVSRQ